jgi:hypothetical protein
MTELITGHVNSMALLDFEVPQHNTRFCPSTFFGAHQLGIASAASLCGVFPAVDCRNCAGAVAKPLSNGDASALSVPREPLTAFAPAELSTAALHFPRELATGNTPRYIINVARSTRTYNAAVAGCNHEGRQSLPYRDDLRYCNPIVK